MVLPLPDAPPGAAIGIRTITGSDCPRSFGIGRGRHRGTFAVAKAVGWWVGSSRWPDGLGIWGMSVQTHDAAPSRGESTVRKTLLFATTFALAFGPAASFAAVSCANLPVVGTQVALAATMTNVMVCEPFGERAGRPSTTRRNGPTELGSFWRILTRHGIRTAPILLVQAATALTVRGTITYSYSGGGNAGPYMVSLDTTTAPKTLYFCADSNGNNNPFVYKAAYIPTGSVTPCP